MNCLMPLFTGCNAQEDVEAEAPTVNEDLGSSREGSSREGSRIDAEAVER